MSTIIAGERARAERVAQGPDGPENARIWALDPAPADEPNDSTGALARALAEFEAEAIGQQPELVVLADDSDAALAAALVATKLLIEVAATAPARVPSSVNGRLIAQLTDA